MGQAERRASPRAAERVTVAIAGAGDDLQADTHNISASGAYCTMDRFIPLMTKVSLRFTLPGGTNGARAAVVRCTGIVVRVEPAITKTERMQYRVGLFFTDLSSRHRAAIERFVRRRLAAIAPRN